MTKKALIFGITGQDGAILSSILLKKNYKVHGICRKNKYSNLFKLNIKRKIKLYLLKNTNKINILKILNKNFNEIYFLGGQSSVFNSFNAIQETYDSQIRPVKIILNFIKIFI
jgi:GDPmannose 4,6-dehydratase